MLILGLKGFNGTCEGAGRGIDKEQFCNNEFTTEKKEQRWEPPRKRWELGVKRKGEGSSYPSFCLPPPYNVHRNDVVVVLSTAVCFQWFCN